MLILDNSCIVKYTRPTDIQQVFGSKRLKMFKHIVEIPEGMYNMEASTVFVYFPMHHLLFIGKLRKIESLYDV